MRQAGRGLCGGGGRGQEAGWVGGSRTSLGQDSWEGATSNQETRAALPGRCTRLRRAPQQPLMACRRRSPASPPRSSRLPSCAGSSTLWVNCMPRAWPLCTRWVMRSRWLPDRCTPYRSKSRCSMRPTSTSSSLHAPPAAPAAPAAGAVPSAAAPPSAPLAPVAAAAAPPPASPLADGAAAAAAAASWCCRARTSAV